jgi:hypothetical protein
MEAFHSSLRLDGPDRRDKSSQGLKLDSNRHTCTHGENEDHRKKTLDVKQSDPTRACPLMICEAEGNTPTPRAITKEQPTIDIESPRALDVHQSAAVRTIIAHLHFRQMRLRMLN